jgi:hypothetical protein
MKQAKTEGFIQTDLPTRNSARIPTQTPKTFEVGHEKKVSNENIVNNRNNNVDNVFEIHLPSKQVVLVYSRKHLGKDVSRCYSTCFWLLQYYHCFLHKLQTDIRAYITNNLICSIWNTLFIFRDNMMNLRQLQILKKPHSMKGDNMQCRG